ncbi:MAG: 4'-phosphopantetheinyl transferase superfamily protein [Deltaproteobacteria bacterium]|jgi:4'-phosphopantetheinyl transferase|nr:4'-phosphopantetheinyl transferase superfamily protein [Deltaproteobacteria bacterium]
MRLYIVSITELAGRWEQGLALLPPARRARALRYLREEDRLRCLAGGLLMRCLLGVREDGQLVEGPYGKPLLTGQGPQFSLSHAGEYAVLAAGNTPNGVDIEQTERMRPLAAKRCMTPEEYALFTQAEAPEELFCTLWTGKESVMKGTGLGMRLDPQSFSLLPLEAGACLIRGEHWSVGWHRLGDGYIIALASREPVRGMELVRLSADELLR